MCLAFIKVTEQNALALLSQPLDVIIVMLSKSVFMLNDNTLKCLFDEGQRLKTQLERVVPVHRASLCWLGNAN